MINVLFVDSAEAMGGAFCLCAMAVPEGRFDEVMTLVNAHPEVAHNYERQHKLNMWFVLACERPGHCLLYTSPSPRDRTRSRMPSSA